jgi:orotidine-5'-phosphate decarboxylase
MGFVDKLLTASRDHKSLLCVGLDPDPGLMPEMDVLQFNRDIIDATKDLVCAYKPNLAFYQALGIEGLIAMEKTREYIPTEIPVIADAKHGDIGNSARQYAKAIFDTFGFDAVTVNPYLGYDSLEPFINRSDRGVFVLCKTSNVGASDFQDLRYLEPGISDAAPLFQVVALKAKEWNVYGNVGLVVGATHAEALRTVRELCPEMVLLIPGIGAQGGDLASAVTWGVDAQGQKAIICCSRQILYASKGEDFALAAREEALKIRDQINQHLAALWR